MSERKPEQLIAGRTTYLMPAVHSYIADYTTILIAPSGKNVRDVRSDAFGMLRDR
jgi:hypothetical protein